MRRMHYDKQIEHIAEEEVKPYHPQLWHHKIILTLSPQEFYNFEVDLPYDTKVETKDAIPWREFVGKPVNGGFIQSGTPVTFQGIGTSASGSSPSDQFNMIAVTTSGATLRSIYITLTTWGSISDTVTPQ